MNLNNSDFNRIKNTLQKFLGSQFEKYGAMHLSEQAVPSYTHKYGIMRYVFWNRIKIALRAARSQRDPGVCLDFGSGSGIILPFLAHNNQQTIYAFDIADQSIQMLNALKNEMGLTSVQLLNSFQQIKDLPDQSIDTITALDVFEHLETLDEVLAILKSKLKPSGVLIVSSPTETALYKFMRNFGGKEYHGHYHHSDAKGVENALKKLFTVKVVGRIFPILEYFRIVKASN